MNKILDQISISIGRATQILLILSFLLMPASCRIRQVQTYSAFQLGGFAQGTNYQISYYAKNPMVSSKTIEQIFMELDSSLSIYKPYSLISQFNTSENGLEMDEHLYQVVKRSLKLWKESEGVFDISILPLIEVWGFGVKRHNIHPSEAQINQARTCSGSDKLHIQGRRLVKDIPCLKIDVNGIAQGYSVDVIADYLESLGIQNYLVEIGGEIRLKGRKQPGNQIMRIGIEQPAHDSDQEPLYQKIIEMKGGAITTSGNYRKYIQNGSRLLSHLMNPLSGRPLENEIISVTVRSKDGISADGYDNVLMAKGINDAFLFLKRHKKLEAYFIYKAENGVVRDTSTKYFFE
ncbi:MAG: FAD:protein FMN transferase [Bacteroidetes bacterium]|nr:FAD:protein FMN transferase [Bacteroidota bacterium]